MFNKIIADLLLLYPHLVNGSFTWSVFRGVPICSCIDRFLYKEGWKASFPFYVQETRFRGVSDHFPITLKSCPVKWGPCAFRLDNSWLANKDFCRLVKEEWGRELQPGWEGFCFMRKLKNLKDKIKERAVEERSKVSGLKLYV